LLHEEEPFACIEFAVAVRREIHPLEKITEKLAASTLMFASSERQGSRCATMQDSTRSTTRENNPLAGKERPREHIEGLF